MVGIEAVNSAPLSNAPISDASRPDIIENRDGAHSGELQ